MQFPRIMFVFAQFFKTSYKALKLFIIFLNKVIRFQYFLCIACYRETKCIIDCVSVIPIDELTDI